MIERLTKKLRPERAAEEEAIEAVAALPRADLLTDMIERAAKREWLHGAETGRREVIEELAETKARDAT